MPATRRRSQGFTLVEILLVMGIGMLITIGVWRVFSERQVILRGTALEQAIESLFIAADDAYAASSEFVTINAAGTRVPAQITRLAAAIDGDMPAGVEPSGTGYVNRWGGAWTIATASSDGGGHLDLLAITVRSVPQGECKIVLANLAPHLYDTRVNGTLVHLELAPSATDNARTSVDFSQAMPLCRATPNTMVFRKLKDLKLPDLRRIWPYPDGLTNEEMGLAPSWRYQESYSEHAQRIENALAAREAAQAAMD